MMAAGPDRVRRTHFPCLDGYRAIAALAVVTFATAGALHLHQRSPLGAGSVLLGTSGVAIFSMVSGFLLYRPYALSHITGRSGPSGARSFYRRRILRVYPAYGVALAVAAYGVGTTHLGRVSSAILFFGLVHNYKRSLVFEGLGQSWMLCIGVSFYALLPPLAGALGRLHRGSHSATRRRRSELIALTLLALAATGYRVLVAFVGAGSDAVPMLWLPAYLDWFAVGMAFAVLSAAEESGVPNPSPLAYFADRPLMCWALAAELFWMLTLLHLPRGAGPATPAQLLVSHVVFAAAAAAFLVPGVLGPQDEGLIRRALQSPGLVWLGTVSYGVFLWHSIWLSQLLRWAHYRGSGLSFATLLFFLLITTLPSAWASYVLIERPLMSKRLTSFGDGRGRAATELGASR
jgi:peptidoglycan/LPS O-acetylase OafA/YrhL